MFLAAVLVPAGALAVPASPEVHVLAQPDGTTFTAIQWGDENGHGWETEDGYTIVFEKNMNAWTYARHDLNGNLVGTAYIAGKDAPPADMKKRVRPLVQKDKPVVKRMTTKEMRFNTSGETSLTTAPPMPDGPELIVPPVGSASFPVILINFPGRTVTYTTSNFNSLLFGTGNHSMKDYYKEVSYGAFHLSGGTGIAGRAVPVAGWYKAQNNHDYYGANDYSGTDSYPGTLVREAVEAADLAGFQFEAYDADGDCYVDVVGIVHQGTGAEASGNSNDIWSHRWNLNDAFSSGRSDGGEYTTIRPCPGHPGVFMKVNDYIIMPEKMGSGMSTMGVFAHEYGHSFGLPDLYDTSNYSEGIGNWSIMAGGSWNKVTRPGDRPAHMDPWCKYELGWITPTLVTSTLYHAPITAAGADFAPTNVYKLLSSGTPTSGEYFLVENRQKTGFDAGLPGAGLLIWHIDGNYVSSTMSSNAVNSSVCIPSSPGSCSSWHYGVALVQADNNFNLEAYASPYNSSSNRGDSGDPYPGKAVNRDFSLTSDPYNNSRLYNGLPSDVTVTDISSSGAIMTATMNAGAVLPITVQDAVDNPTFDNATWVYGGAADWSGQTFFQYYGGSAARSGSIGNSESSSMYNTVTLASPGTLSFFWKVSSEASRDFLKFSINGLQKAAISGEVGWKQMTYTLAAGTYTLAWNYVKNASVSQGVDAGWVDKIEISPFTKVQVVTPDGGSVYHPGDVVTVTWNSPAQAEKYNVYYTFNNGLSYTKIASNVTGTSADWTVPPMNGNKTACKVKVLAYTASGALVGSDISNTNFTIEVLKVNAPNGGLPALISGATGTINYTISSTVTPIANTMLFYTVDGGVTWKTIYTDTTNITQGTYDFPWTVPPVAGSKAKCKVKVVIKSAGGVVLGTDVSDGFFPINP